MKKPLSVTCLLCLLALSVRAATPQDGALSYLRPRHRAVLQKWLGREKRELRLAEDEDGATKEDLEAAKGVWGPGYHPYYAVGDFNRDGYSDFAVGLLDKSKPTKLIVAIFNGSRKAARMVGPSFLDDSFGLNDWIYWKPRYGLLIGPFESDAGVFIKPRSRGYVIKG
jgi:hypothetical protein